MLTDMARIACPECKGEREVTYLDKRHGMDKSRVCPTCEGSGDVWSCPKCKAMDVTLPGDDGLACKCTRLRYAAQLEDLTDARRELDEHIRKAGEVASESHAGMVPA